MANLENKRSADSVLAELLEARPNRSRRSNHQRCYARPRRISQRPRRISALNQYLAGSLFTHDYLTEAIQSEVDYNSIDVDAVRASLKTIFDKFPTGRSPSEAQTEDDLIWPILVTLGWDHVVRQQNLAPVGRDNVPDGLLFLDEAAKDQARKSMAS